MRFGLLLCAASKNNKNNNQNQEIELLLFHPFPHHDVAAALGVHVQRAAGVVPLHRRRGVGGLRDGLRRRREVLVHALVLRAVPRDVVLARALPTRVTQNNNADRHTHSHTETAHGSCHLLCLAHTHAHTTLTHNSYTHTHTRERMGEGNEGCIFLLKRASSLFSPHVHGPWQVHPRVDERHLLILRGVRTH